MHLISFSPKTLNKLLQIGHIFSGVFVCIACLIRATDSQVSSYVLCRGTQRHVTREVVNTWEMSLGNSVNRMRVLCHCDRTVRQTVHTWLWAEGGAC